MRLLLLTLPLFFVACSFSSNKNSQNYSYDFNENDCPTGKQNFGSKSDMCAGLQNDSLNNYCAAALRQEYYEQNCQ